MARKSNESASADQPESNGDDSPNERLEDADPGEPTPADDVDTSDTAEDTGTDEDGDSTTDDDVGVSQAKNKSKKASQGKNSALKSANTRPRKRKRVIGKRLRVWPYFTVLSVVTGLLWFFALAGVSFDNFPTPKLGLDLQGGTSMTLTASLPGGEAPKAENMEQARQIIENRVNGTGVAEPEVYVEGSNNIVVNIAGKDTNDEALREIGAAAELRFREVLSGPMTDYSLQDPEDFETTPAEDSEEAEPDESDEIDSSESPTDDESVPADDESVAPEDDESVPADDETTPAEEENPADLDSDLLKLREAVYTKLGDEMVTAAEQLVAGGQPIPEDQLAGAMEYFKPFSELTAEEVAALPPMMQYVLPTIGCGQLNARTPGAISNAEIEVVACNKPSADEIAAGKEQGVPVYAKYLLSPSTVLGDDVSSAVVQQDQANPGYWAVGITFTNEGADKWVALAKKTQGKSVAIVLDNLVVSAPTIQSGAANGGSVEITGQFTSDSARVLAEQLNYGSLPIAFKVETIDSVSATLGTGQLEAGLYAGLIGVGLVVLYSLVYYRLLGFVVIVSLLAAAAVLYPTITMLGQQIGLTLTLAGVAGFIVAIGITADSFVVFFERLKEEMKNGRSTRSAVPRAWVRARHTILSANTVSFLAAVVLYFLAIGAVRGFAFTLGLSTLVDILIVFLFTHPLVAWLSRFRLLDSPLLSGLHTHNKSTEKNTMSSAVTAQPKES